MSRKWLEKEGQHWVRDGLIQHEQYEQILKRYPIKSSKSLLPIFASILVGLGILTFIASNWDVIPNLLKLLIIIVVMTSFYIFGDKKWSKGDTRFGHALIGLGIITFGAGIVLITQMFHFTFNNAANFILWSLGSLCMLALYRSKFIFFLTILIITVGQVYSTIEYGGFSYILAFLLLFGVGHFVYNRATEEFSTVFSIAFLVTGLTFVVNENLSYLWLTILNFVLIQFAEVTNRKVTFRMFKLTGIVFQIILVCFNIFFMDELIRYEPEQLPGVPYYLILLLLAGIYLLLILRIKEQFKLVYVLLFIPAILFGDAADVVYILVLYSFSIITLIIGYQYQKSEYVNTGTFVFLVSTFVAYIQLAWDFMPKSMFFLSGGILLFALSWYLEKRRRKWLKLNGGEPH